jgi:hypothetical protein
MVGGQHAQPVMQPRVITNNEQQQASKVSVHTGLGTRALARLARRACVCEARRQSHNGKARSSQAQREQLEQPCAGMPRDTQGCPEMPRDAQGCPGMPRDAQGCPGMPRDVQGCPGMPRDAQGYPGMPRDAQRCPGMPRVQAWQGHRPGAIVRRFNTSVSLGFFNI